jgi:hypothetical protein
MKKKSVIFLLIFIIIVSILRLEKVHSRINASLAFRYQQIHVIFYSKRRVYNNSIYCKRISENKYRFGDFVWERLTTQAEYGKRDGAAIVWHNGKLYLVGGWNPNNNLKFPKKTANDVWSSTDGKSWQLEKPQSFDVSWRTKETDWEGRHKAGLVSFKGALFLIGGDANQGHHQSDIWRSTDGRSWVRVLEKAPWGPRALHISFVFQDAIYVLGGQTMPKFASKESVSEVYYNDVWRSSDGRNWEQIALASPVWTPRGATGGDGFVFNGRIFLVGGFVYDGRVNKERYFLADIWSSADGASWRLEAAKPQFVRSNEGFGYHDMAIFDDQIWILGGARRWGNSSEVWSSSDGRNWREHRCTPFPPSHASSVVSSPDGIIFAAGNHMTTEVWKLTKLKPPSQQIGMIQ